MGINYIDIYTLHHFTGGILAQSLLNSLGMSTCKNFIISNGLHSFIEYIEHNVSPTGKILENTRNHVTDILAFLLGWGISMYFHVDISERYQLLAWIILVASTLKEVIRELFPYSCIGAFRD